MTLTTTGWPDGDPIPAKFTQAGEQVSPALTWTNTPPGTVTFFLHMHDPDVARNKTTDDQVHRDASPIEAVRGDAPPFLVVHGRNDTLVPVEEARLFVERLRAISASPVLYIELPGTEHAFDVFPSIRSSHVVRAVGRFVELLRLRATVTE